MMTAYYLIYTHILKKHLGSILLGSRVEIALCVVGAGREGQAYFSPCTFIYSGNKLINHKILLRGTLGILLGVKVLVLSVL